VIVETVFRTNIFLQGHETWNTARLNSLTNFVFTIRKRSSIKYSRDKGFFFSDDTKLLVTGEDECALQHEIEDVTEELQTWFHKNNLTMNTHRQKIAMPFRNEQYRNPLQLQVMFDNMYIVYK
jgi:hypothetical protein